jgi:hypothetical protein
MGTFKSFLTPPTKLQVDLLLQCHNAPGFYAAHQSSTTIRGVSVNVITMDCFFRTASTVAKQFEESVLEDISISHQGNGPFENDTLSFILELEKLSQYSD